jgi:hypothetical protein
LQSHVLISSAIHLQLSEEPLEDTTDRER